MSPTAPVTVCVPVYNGDAFLAETLSAIQQQRHDHLTVLVSDDASTDGSADICRSFVTDGRFKVSTQSPRLGWVENCNWLLKQATTDLVCIVSHDDIPEVDFVARLAACLAAHPDAALAFTDIQVFGLLDHVECQPSLTGSMAERLRAFLANHFDGTGFHALIRRSALDMAGGLRRNAMDDFAADVSWVGRLAAAGDCHRVPEPLYRKRRYSTSASMRWGAWSHAKNVHAWCVHCRELLDLALSDNLTPPERQTIVHAVIRRLLAIEPRRPFPFIRQLTQAQQARMVALLHTGSHSGVDDAIDRWLTSPQSDPLE